MERLDKLLAGTGRFTRREVKELAKAGRIVYEGKVTTDTALKLPEDAVLTVDGVQIPLAQLVYLMLHKPQGVVSSTEDPREKTVLELLPKHYRSIGLFPAGRLDKDTTGLLLLTNDGPLAHALLSPRHHVKKTYLATVNGRLDEADVTAFAAGITLADGTKCLPAGLKILEDGQQCIVTLEEGKYHQIKRMLASRGKPVTDLQRLSMGDLRLDSTLSPGEWRNLTQKELETLRFSASIR